MSSVDVPKTYGAILLGGLFASVFVALISRVLDASADPLTVQSVRNREPSNFGVLQTLPVGFCAAQDPGTNV